MIWLPVCWWFISNIADTNDEINAKENAAQYAIYAREITHCRCINVHMYRMHYYVAIALA